MTNEARRRMESALLELEEQLEAELAKINGAGGVTANQLRRVREALQEALSE